MSAAEAGALQQLVYLSSAVGPLGMADLEEILLASRRNNAAAGVTGLLLFHDGCFFQALEGPGPDVHAIFGRIRRDPRHTGTIVLQDRPSTERAFASWSMGFVGSSRLSDSQRETLIDLSALLDGEERPDFSASPAISRQIDTFLNTFREFAAG